MKRKLLTVLLAVVMVFGVFGLTACGGSNPDSDYNYYGVKYELDDVKIEAATFQGVYKMFTTPGSFLLYVDSEGEGAAERFAAINALANEWDVTIYHFNPDLAGGFAAGKGASANILTSAIYGDGIKTVQKTLEAISGKKVAELKDNALWGIKGADSTVSGGAVKYNGKLAAQVSYAADADYSDALACTEKFPSYGDKKDVNRYVLDVVNTMNLFGDARLHMYNDDNGVDALTAEKEDVYVTVANYGMFEHLLLKNEGYFSVFFGGTWCPNTQAIVKATNQLAKDYGIEKIYFFDPRLEDGTKIDAVSNGAIVENSAYLASGLNTRNTDADNTWARLDETNPQIGDLNKDGKLVNGQTPIIEAAIEKEEAKLLASAVKFLDSKVVAGFQRGEGYADSIGFGAVADIMLDLDGTIEALAKKAYEAADEDNDWAAATAKAKAAEILKVINVKAETIANEAIIDAAEVAGFVYDANKKDANKKAISEIDQAKAYLKSAAGGSKTDAQITAIGTAASESYTAAQAEARLFAEFQAKFSSAEYDEFMDPQIKDEDGNVDDEASAAALRANMEAYAAEILAKVGVDYEDIYAEAIIAEAQKDKAFAYTAIDEAKVTADAIETYKASKYNYGYLYANFLDNYLKFEDGTSYASMWNVGVELYIGSKVYTKMCVPNIMMFNGEGEGQAKLVALAEAEYTYANVNEEGTAQNIAWTSAVKAVFDANPYAEYAPVMVVEEAPAAESAPAAGGSSSAGAAEAC